MSCRLPPRPLAPSFQWIKQSETQRVSNSKLRQLVDSTDLHQLAEVPEEEEAEECQRVSRQCKAEVESDIIDNKL